MPDETARETATGSDTMETLVFPASFAQQRLWFLDQLAPGSAAYNIGQLKRIRAPIDPVALERSLQEIGRRHEVLRTTFESTDGQPVQVVSPEQALSLTFVDLSVFPPAERYAEAIRLEGEAIREPFDLESGPLLRLSLMRLDENDHALLLTMHHVVGDGWSVDVFFRELAALYEAFASGRPSPLPPLPIQYADYSVWQRDSLQGEWLDQRLSYWKRQLADLPVFELPGDRPRPPEQTFRAGRRSVFLPAALAKALKAVAQSEGGSLYMALLAAFQTLLFRLTGQDDVILGSPTAERHRTETEPLIGFFVNTLALRSDLSGDPTFRELLGRVRKVVLDAFTHELPFEKLVEALQPARDLSRTPLFQVLFNMLNFEVPRVRIAGAWVEPIEVPEKGSLFDLTLYGADAPDGLRFWLVYNADLFDGERMTGLLEQFAGLLEQIASAPDARIGSYSLVTPAARRLLPDPAAPLDEPHTGVVVDEFLRWSERTPDAAAIAADGRAWTYRELEERSRAIAERLVGDGLAPGEVVGVTGPRSAGFVSGMLAVLRGGGVLLTLDPALPAARRALMISEANARRIIHVSAAEASAGAETRDDGTGSARAIRVDRDGRLVSEDAVLPAAPLPRVAGDDPAYVFFTSGSTGVPHAILGSHKGLAHFLGWQRKTFAVGPGDRCSQLSGVSFDVVLRDVFLPLTSGASVYLPDADEDPGSSRVVSWLDREGITILHAVPSVVQSWLAALPAGASLARLRWAFFAGEPLTDALVRRWRTAFPEAGRIVNLYGPTETTLVKCFYVVPSDPPPGIQPAGNPLPDTQALILADGARLCGVGEVGEIVLRTPFRTFGYVNAPREQQERFVPNPFRTDARDLLYRTGDLGRYRSDGSVAILGRRDDQVKIRGVRVEPAEVAAVLSSHPRVAACAVVSRPDGDGETTLVAYVVHARRREADTAAELRTFLSGRLPAAMIPSAFGFLDEIPLTPNGKLDRAALPPIALPAVSGARPERPATPVEEMVAAIWSAVLGVERVGLSDNFFELGGHSLKATRVLSRVNQAFGVDLRIRALFENPVFSAFSWAVEAALSLQEEVGSRSRETAGATPESAALSRRRTTLEAAVGEVSTGTPDPVRRAPLSFAQQRLWFLDQLDPGLGSYNLTRAHRLSGRLDVEALERALRTMEERHEALRTVFALRDDGPVQVVTPPGRAGLSKVDLSGLPPETREAEAARSASQHAQGPFDLGRGPLLRAVLLRLSDEDHVLVVTVHHVVFDGWSVEVFERELGELYGAYREGLPSPLAELPVQYADFAVWQREWLAESGSVLQEQLSYWKKQLEGAPAVLDLGVSRPRPARQTFRGASESTVLGEKVSEALRRLGRGEGATLFMTLLAAFQVLLLRRSGQEDILVGSVVAGRNRSEIEGLIGFFVNTLVFRTDLSGDPTFRQLLSRVRGVAIEAYGNQDLPFEKLVEELNPERTESHSPVFQVMMNYRSAPARGPKLAGLSVSAFPLERRTSKFDLTAHFDDSGRHVGVSFEYNRDLFEAETVARMLSHLEVLLEGIAQDPDRPVSELPMLTREELHRVVVEWNDTGNDEPAQLLHGPFEDAARGTPDALALEGGDRRLTYGQLNQRANRLARHLGKLGVGPGVLVGLCLDRSIEAMVGMLAILKAGGAYLPLDPAYPRERLRFMLEDSGAHALLTLRALAESVPTLAGRTIHLDDASEAIAREDASDFDSGVAPHDLAYVIYTSGSTGKPKGVEIEHGEISNHVRFATQRFGSRGGDRILQFASLSFDTSLQEIFPTLWGGAALVLRSPEMIESVAGFLARCREWGLTVIDLPTAYWHEVVAVASAEGLELPRALRLVIIGGEAALPERFAQWEKLAAGRVRLINGYGPTEASVAATFWEPGANAAAALGRVVPIGRPIANTRTYVVDARMQPAPIGVAGDLLIGGAGVARGYRKRPDLTAERFIPDPFRGGEDRVYRTGDRARWIPSGELEYLGRVDGQIKIRGFRVELGEIETALRGVPGVRDAVVRALPDASGTARLVGWVISEREHPPSVGELRRRLKESLPEHMVPSAFVELAAFPRTPNGKLDAAALPAPESARPELDSAYCEPRTAVERALADIWARVLGIGQVGVHDNFFELGGHSLLATRVVSRARDLFHLDLPLRELFAHPTVADLASSIDRRLADRLASPEPDAVPASETIGRRAGRENAPVSFAQQRLWFLDQLDPGLGFYNIARGYRLEGDLDVPALERAFRGIEERHEVLRTVFALTADGPVQVVGPAGGVKVSTTDLTGLPEESREREAIRLAEENAKRPFDLSRGPLLRADLLRLGERDHVLAVTVHHVAFDGWSLDVFERELGQLYEAFAAGESPALPELPVQYGDYAVWQREWLAGEVLEEQLSYWKGQLKGAPAVLELSVSGPRPPRQTFRGATESLVLSKPLSDSVRRLAQAEKATLFMTLLAAFQVFLLRHSGQEDVVVGSPVAGRNRSDVEGLIGFFVNTLVFRTDLSGDPSFREAIERVRSVAIDAYAHQDVPFEKLVEELNPERTLSHSPLFQVMMILQSSSPDAGPVLPGISVSGLELEGQSAKFDLTASFVDTGERIGVRFQYNPDLFHAETVVRMLSHMEVLLAAIVQDPDRAVSRLPLLTPRERNTVLVEWNDTDAALPPERSVSELFETQAARTPDADAVVFGRERWTYRQLNERSNRLARHLRGLGVGPAVLVGLCLERSPEMVAGILAVLKAGGAYVPLDPAYPPERLAFMLEDAAARVVLTHDHLAGVLPSGLSAVRVRLDADAAEIARQSGENPSALAGPDDLAYVIYTSGSTGTPKGVQVEHRNAVALIAWGRDFFSHGELGGVLASTSVCFDLSIFELLVPLCSGGAAIIARDALELPDLDAASEVTLVNTVPSAMAELLRSGRFPDSVRTINLAGEPLAPALVDAVLRSGAGRRVFDLYGPTEDTTYSTCARRLAEAPATIGRPISNKRIYVLDRHLEPVPIGVAGDLFVAGAGVARGYLGRPDATAERFLADPFRGGAERMYRTGDRGRHLPDGRIQFLGRLDDQVKVRGYRIELGEIETALSKHPSIRACAVAAREEPSGDKRLVGYVVSRDGAALSPGEIRAFLKTTLPEFMIPSRFLFLEALPLTSNGKVDRRALPEPEASRPELEDAFLAPRNAVEDAVAAIWRQVLGLERIGVRDNFFDLGGHSLLAMQVISRARDAFQVELPLRALFESPTVAGLAAEIEKAKGLEGGARRPPIAAVSRRALATAPAPEEDPEDPEKPPARTKR